MIGENNMYEALKLVILDGLEECAKLLHKLDDESGDADDKIQVNAVLIKLAESLQIIVRLEHVRSLEAMRKTDTR